MKVNYIEFTSDIYKNMSCNIIWKQEQKFFVANLLYIFNEWSKLVKADCIRHAQDLSLNS